MAGNGVQSNVGLLVATLDLSQFLLIMKGFYLYVETECFNLAWPFLHGSEFVQHLYHF